MSCFACPKIGQGMVWPEEQDGVHTSLEGRVGCRSQTQAAAHTEAQQANRPATVLIKRC